MLARRNPLRDMMRLRNEMDRMFEDSFLGRQWEWPEGFSGALPLDFAEKEDEYLVKASIPGMDPEDIDITYSNGTLTIRGEVQEEKETEEEQYHLRERRYGSFSRSLTVPTSIQADKIEAYYDKGVLTLHLPKAEETKPKRISVKPGSQKVIEAKSK